MANLSKQQVSNYFIIIICSYPINYLLYAKYCYYLQQIIDSQISIEMKEQNIPYTQHKLCQFCSVEIPYFTDRCRQCIDAYQMDAFYQICSICHQYYLMDLQQIHLQICQGKVSSQEGQYNPIFVSCQDCLQELLIQQLQSHENECLLKPIKCSFCNIQMPKTMMNEHPPKCQALQEECSRCHLSFKRRDLTNHQRSCVNPRPIRASRVENENGNNQFMALEGVQLYFSDYSNKCKWCFQTQNNMNGQLSKHQKECMKKIEIFSYLHDQDTKLTQIQIEALKKMYEKSSEQHKKQRNIICSNVFQMGYSDADLFLMSQYLYKQSPIIIHINLERDLKNFVKDTHYRNLFETNISSGSRSTQSRILWENYLFGNSYNKAGKQQRVKYGVMNFLNDRIGFSACKQYGSSFMILKKSIRKRCTIAHQRTYGKGQIVTTLKYNYPILAKFTKDELKALHLASLGHQIISEDLKTFKQIQIHGPIEFSKDVECIYAPEQEIQKNKQDVQKFIQKFKVPILQIQKI